MKKLKEIVIVLGILYLSEFIQGELNLMLPSTILGMLILTALLMTKVVKLEDVEWISSLLLGYLAFFFVPVVVGVRDSIGEIKDIILPLLFIVSVSTIVVMIVTTITVERINKRLDMKEGGR